MKLNEKGQAASNKWYGIYCAEMDRLDRETPGHSRGGWSILEEEGLVKDIKDWVEMLVCFYAEYAIDYTYELQDECDGADDECAFGCSYNEVRAMLKEYYEEVA